MASESIKYMIDATSRILALSDFVIKKLNHRDIKLVVSNESKEKYVFDDGEIQSINIIVFNLCQVIYDEGDSCFEICKLCIASMQKIVEIMGETNKVEMPSQIETLKSNIERKTFNNSDFSNLWMSMELLISRIYMI